MLVLLVFPIVLVVSSYIGFGNGNENKDHLGAGDKEIKVVRHPDGTATLVSPNGISVSMTLIDKQANILIESPKCQLVISEHKGSKSGLTYHMGYRINKDQKKNLLDLDGDWIADLAQLIENNKLVSQSSLEVIEKPIKNEN